MISIYSTSTSSFESRKRSTPLVSNRPPSSASSSTSAGETGLTSFIPRPKPPRNRRSSVEVGLKALEKNAGDRSIISTLIEPSLEEGVSSPTSIPPNDFLSPKLVVEEALASEVPALVRFSPPLDSQTFSLNPLPVDRATTSLFDESPIKNSHTPGYPVSPSEEAPSYFSEQDLSDSTTQEEQQLALDAAVEKNAELLTKLKVMEERMSASATHFEEEYVELQGKLEDVSSIVSSSFTIGANIFLDSNGATTQAKGGERITIY